MLTSWMLAGQQFCCFHWHVVTWRGHIDVTENVTNAMHILSVWQVFLVSRLVFNTQETNIWNHHTVTTMFFCFRCQECGREEKRKTFRRSLGGGFERRGVGDAVFQRCLHNVSCVHFPKNIAIARFVATTKWLISSINLYKIIQR